MSFDEYIKENISEEKTSYIELPKQDFSWLNDEMKKTGESDTKDSVTTDTNHCEWLKYALEHPNNNSAGDWSN